MHIIVDGYNMIRQLDSLRRSERYSLEAGRQALIRLISLYKKKRSHKLTVVFDGWESGSPLEERDFASGIYIIYSKLGEKADDVIKRMVRSKEEEVVVVTSDRDIISFVERKEGAVISPRDFEEKISGAQNESGYFAHQEDDDGDRTVERANKKGPAKRLSRKKKNDLAKMRKL